MGQREDAGGGDPAQARAFEQVVELGAGEAAGAPAAVRTRRRRCRIRVRGLKSVG